MANLAGEIGISRQALYKNFKKTDYTPARIEYFMERMKKAWQKLD